SEHFDMGDANGHWGYIEDNDGTLVEFVETHKVPLIKKINWSIKLKNRDPHKPLPGFILKAMAITKRVKFD
ncbi:MAG: VOC family protein, partial [Reichenbachiella sp.]